MANRYWVGGTASWDGTAGTKWALTSGGAGGEAVPTSTDDVFFDANSGANTVTIATGNTGCLSLDCTGFTGTLAGTASITISGSLTFAGTMTRSFTGTITFNKSSGTAVITSNGIAFGGGITLNGAGTFQLADNFLHTGSGVTMTFTAGTFDPNGKLARFTLANGTTATFSGNKTWNFYDATFDGLNNQTISLNVNLTVTNLLTITGQNAGQFRQLVQSGTVGTARTITAASVALTNIDFADITGAGAATWSGTSIADLGGNSNITFTTPTTRYWVGGTGNWSDTTEWAATSGGGSGASVPLAHDTVVFDANSFSAGSQVVTVDVRHLGDISFANATNNPTITIITSTRSIFGSLVLKSGMTVTAGTLGFTFSGRGAYNINTDGVTCDIPLSINAFGGTYTLQSNLTTGKAKAFTVTRGTFDANNNNLTIGSLSSSGSTTRAITWGSGTWEITGTGVVLTFSTSTNLTLTGTSHTIKLTDASASNKTLSCGTNKSLGNLWITGAGTGTYSINCSTGVTFNDFKVDTPPHTVIFQTPRTITVTSFTVVGTSGNLITMEGLTPGLDWTLSKSSGIVNCEYISLRDSAATGGAQFFAGINSIDVSNNTGWTFGTSGINVFDSETVTEDISRVLTSNIDTNDVETITENVEMFTNLYHVSVQDSPILAEDLVVFQGHVASVADTVTMTESAVSQNEQLAGISEVDTLTISETTTLLEQSNINNFDVVSVGESSNVTTIFNSSVFDLITVNDSFVDPEDILSLNINETITVVEISTFDSIRYSADSGRAISGSMSRVTGNS